MKMNVLAVCELSTGPNLRSESSEVSKKPQVIQFKPHDPSVSSNENKSRGML